MSEIISYGKSDVLGEGSVSSLDTTETLVFSVTEGSRLTQSQISLYISDISLGTNTAIELRVYHLNEVGGTYAQLCKVNETTGDIEDTHYDVVSGTPATAMFDIPMSASFGFKVTAKGVGGGNGAVKVKALGRNN